MKTVTTKAMAKVAAVATGLAMATSMLSLAPIAHAACSVGTTNLMVGSSGSAVTCLQQTLIAAGYSVPAGATGYFGAQTKAAVMAWQAAVGISPAAGYFGPISRPALGGSMTSTGGSTGSTSTVAGCAAGAMYSSTTGAMCSTPTSTVAGCAAGAMYSSTTGQACSTTTTTTTGTMTGSGRLTNVSSYGSVYSDLKEGDASTAVVGVQADATNGDVSIQRVDVVLDIGGNGSSNLDKYVSDVSLYLNGTKLASMSPSLGDKTTGGVWTYRFSGLTGIVKSGTTGNIVVKVTPVSTIGSDEDGDQVTATLAVNSVRAVGADGISDTYISSAINQNFTVSSATTGTLTVTAAGDNPTSSQIAVSSSTTTGVKLLSFNLKAKNSNIMVDDLVASLGTSDNNLNDVINTVYLMKGSTVLKTTTLSTGTYGTVTFSNLNENITKDATNNYSIVVDLKGDSSYADGTTVIASTTLTGWDVQDATGSSVTPSAAAVGNTQTLTATGISVARGTPTATVATGLVGTGDVGTYAIPFTVTAGDNDVFISGVTGTSGATTKIVFATTTSSGQAKTNQGTANFAVSNFVTGDVAGSYFKVLAGTSRTFTLTVAYTATATGFTGLQISSIAYGLTSSLGSTYSSNLDTFKTTDINLVMH